KYMSGAFENVGWSQPGWESLYNICMMEELHTILSVGGGGVTKLVNPRTGRIERLSNPKYPQEYLSQFSRVLADKKYAAEFYAAMGKETDHGISNQ
ncbi:MAG: coproporphyrinogen dehydrogenase HemZ, partial [Oscillospiraceae bacterium]|nr:coproporphyrinogen dehydrogenase HemZ [Oscillospiraceae bacterium]